jgi:hypothetical protein
MIKVIVVKKISKYGNKDNNIALPKQNGRVRSLQLYQNKVGTFVKKNRKLG